MLIVSFRKCKGDRVDLILFLFDGVWCEGLMLGGGSIFNGKSRHGRERRASWRHIVLHPQFCHRLALSRISKDMTFAPDDGISVNFPWGSGRDGFYFFTCFNPHPKVKILPTLLMDWYRFFWTYFYTRIA